MYTLFDKPTENMNKSMRELNEAAYNESLESYKQQEERRKLEEYFSGDRKAECEKNRHCGSTANRAETVFRFHKNRLNCYSCRQAPHSRGRSSSPRPHV